MMSDDIRIMPEIYEIYPTLPSILRKYERYGRKDYFRGQSAEEFMTWRMRSLYLSALDERIHASFLSGYMYGFRDSLLQMNRNCSCNYVPHLMEHFEMGDIASLIAPRRLMIQSCQEDRLAGTRGLANVQEQVDIIRANYTVTGNTENVQQDIEDGPHHLDTSRLQDIVEWLAKE